LLLLLQEEGMNYFIFLFIFVGIVDIFKERFVFVDDARSGRNKNQKIKRKL